MNESGRDEQVKFVITPRKCKLPSDILMVAITPPQEASSHTAEPFCSHRSIYAEHAQSSLKKSQGSPRERRIRAQLASSASSSNSMKCMTSPTVLKFPKQWGSPPSKLSPVKVKLPEGYGVGSVTIRSWIIHRMHDVRMCSCAEKCEAVTQPNDTPIPYDSAALVGIDSFTRRIMRHPDVPWAPDGSSWSSFKMKFEVERHERRQQREAARSSAAKDPAFGNFGAPIVPCLLLENIRDLLLQRVQNRPSTPLSTRHLQHQLEQFKSQRAVSQVQSDVPPKGSVLQSSILLQGQSCDACASQQPSAATSNEVHRRHTLAPVAHEASLTQRLMRLSSLKRRFQEVCALSGDDKKEARAIISQRAKVVLELRHHKSQVQSRKVHPESPGQLLPKAQHEDLRQSRPPIQKFQCATHSLQDSEHLYVTVDRQKTRLHSRHSTTASRQCLWITAIQHSRAILLLEGIIWTGKMRQVKKQKLLFAALTIQKVFRRKLLPYHARQLVKAVAILKPWVADALVRWRQRRLHRSADILRHVLVSSRKCNKMFSCIRAFRQKVVRIQRAVRSFLSCTHARIVRLLKLLHVQVGAMPFKNVHTIC